jgi:hypothetical protein
LLADRLNTLDTTGESEKNENLNFLDDDDDDHLSVLRVSSHSLLLGEIQAIIRVLLFPANESLRRNVSLLDRNGT